MTSAIKICGIKTAEEVKTVNHYPVSYIGFIFAPSKRQITTEQARKLRAMVRKDIQVVGVFMDQPVDDILKAIEVCGLDVVQLHGNERDGMIRQLPVPVWKSIAIKDEASLRRLKDYPSAEGLLLDTYHKGSSGGTGKVFNWALVKDLKLPQKLILAGGLTPDNVTEAMKRVAPDILDLNSGLETNLIKDPAKVAALFETLKKDGLNP